MAESRPRDRVRVAVYSVAAATVAMLLFAGFVYQPPPSADALVSGARFLLRMGLVQEAEADLDRALRLDPEHPAAHLLKGYAALHGERFKESLDHFEAGRAAALGQDEPLLAADYLATTGLLRLAHADFAGAAADAAALEERHLRPGAAALIRAYSRLGVGDDTGFRQGLAQAYMRDPSDPAFRVRMEFLSGTIPWAAAFGFGQ